MSVPRSFPFRSSVLVAGGATALLGAALLAPLGGASAGKSPAPAPAAECQAGSVMARAFVDATAGFSTGFTTDGVTKRYNCESPNNLVEVKRLSAGGYEVRFPGISNKGTGPLVASVDVAQLIGGVTTSEDLNIASATRESGGVRTLMVRCGDVDGTTGTDLCDFTVTLFGK